MKRYELFLLQIIFLFEKRCKVRFSGLFPTLFADLPVGFDNNTILEDLHVDMASLGPENLPGFVEFAFLLRNAQIFAHTD